MAGNNTGGKTDRRVLRTRKAIRNAFVQLISERPVESITVKDIADRADINRKTFYNHYTDINELIDDLENEVIRAFDDAMTGIDLHKAMSDPDELYRRLMAIGIRCREYGMHLMSIQYDGELVGKIAGALKNSILRAPTDPGMDEKRFDMLLRFAVAGMLQTYQDWFESDRSEPAEAVTRWLSEIMVNGARGITPARPEDRK